VLEVHDEMALVISCSTVATGPYFNRGAYASGPVNVTWADSFVRQWLSGTFYREHFTPDERARIAQSTIANKSNPRFDSAREDTTDYLFLLSIEEVVYYFGDSGQFRSVNWSTRLSGLGFLDDRYNDARIAACWQTGEPTWWWLRTPGENTALTAVVHSVGSINFDGYYAVTTDGGIRPAMWLYP